MTSKDTEEDDIHSRVPHRHRKILWCGESLLGEQSSFQELEVPHENFDPVQISAGRSHLLVLDSRGTIWSVGDGKAGQLGLLEVQYADTLTAIKPLVPFRKARTSNTPGFKMTRSSASRDLRAERLRPPTDLVLGSRSLSGTEIKSNATDEETVISIHAGPLTSAAITERVPLWESYKVRAVSMGDQHVLALVNMKALSQREATVGVIAWGKSSSGALGIGERVKVSMQAQPVRFPGQEEENTVPVRIHAGHNSSLALMEDGTVYVWGGCGRFQSWVPRRVEMPGQGPFSAIYMGDESSMIYRGNKLYSIVIPAIEGESKAEMPEGGDEPIVTEHAVVSMYDREIYGKITQIHCNGHHKLLHNQRGQVIFSKGEVSCKQSILRIVPLEKFVEDSTCTMTNFYVITDLPLLLQSVEQITQLQGGDYKVPRVVHDALAYFTNRKLFDGKDPVTLTEADSSRVTDIYRAYLHFQPMEPLSTRTPSQVFGLLLRFLASLSCPLFSEASSSRMAEMYHRTTVPHEKPQLLRNAMEEDLSPSARHVMIALLQILSVCFPCDEEAELLWKRQTSGDSLRRMVPPLRAKLVDLLFAPVFGSSVQDTYYSDLWEILFLYIRFPTTWNQDPMDILPVQLYLIMFTSSRVSWCEQVVQEWKKSSDKSHLLDLLPDTLLFKQIVNDVLSPDLPTDQWKLFENIMDFLWSDRSEECRSVLSLLRSLRGCDMDNRQRETAGALVHLMCTPKSGGSIGEGMHLIISAFTHPPPM